MNQVASFKNEGRRNCVGQGDDGGRLKREKIKNICKKINHLKRKVCSSTDYFKCVEILFHKAGSKCAVPKRKKKSVKRGGGPVSASPKRGILFRGKINHVEFFDAPKLFALFEKHAGEVVHGAVNTGSHTEGNTEDHFAAQLARYKPTLSNGNEFVCSLREEPLSLEKNALPGTERVPSQTFQSSGKDLICCNHQWGDVISNPGCTLNGNNAEEPRWVNDDQPSGQVFTNEGKINGENTPQDNKRKKKQVDNLGHYSSINKRMKLGKCEDDENTNRVSPEQLKVDVAQLAPRQQVEWDDSPRGTRMKCVLQDVPIGQNVCHVKDMPPSYTGRMAPKTILQKRTTIIEEGIVKKKILMLKISSIVFNHGEGPMEKTSQVNTLGNALEGRKSIQTDEGNDSYVMTIPTDEVQSKLSRRFTTDDKYMEDEMKMEEDIQFVYNLFCILVVHMNSLFSMCTELLRYNFSDLTFEQKELSSQSKRLIKLIREYQKEESFVIRFAKYILSFCRRDAHIGKGTNKRHSQHGLQPPRRGTIANLDMKFLKKIIKALLKWKQQDQNIQVVITQNKGDNQTNIFKIEIGNHQMVKQNFYVRKLYFCKYNGELFTYLKRLSAVHSQSNWGSTEGEKNDPDGINTGVDKFDGDATNEVALNRVSLYQRCFSPLWKTREGEASAELKEGVELNNGAEKASRMRCTTGSYEGIENYHSASDTDGSFEGDPNEEGEENSICLELFSSRQSNLTKNQMKIIFYLNKILTEEIRCSQDLRIRSKREVEQTEILLWEVKRLQDILSRSDIGVKNTRTTERVLYKTVQMERSTEFFPHQDGKDTHLMEQTTFDENEIDQSIWRRNTELFNVTNDAHGMGGRNSLSFTAAEGEKCVNPFYHPDDFTKGNLIRAFPYEQGIMVTSSKDDGNISKVRQLIGKIFDELMKCHVNTSHPCDKDITTKVDAVEEGHREQPPLEQDPRIKELMEELQMVKKENSEFAEFLEREKRLTSQLSLEVEKQKEVLMEVESKLENERKRNEDLRVHLEKEELVNDALFSQMEEERKVNSDAKGRLAELETKLEEEKGRSNSLEEELAEERERCSLLEAQLTEERERCSLLEAQLTEERERCSLLEAELTEERDNVTALKTELEEERDNVTTLKTELEGERDNVTALKIELEEERDNVTTLKTELEEERDNVIALKTELEGERDNVTTLKTELEEERDNVIALKTELEGERDNVTTLKTELEEEKGRSNSLEEELAEERERFSSLEAELTEERDNVTTLKTELEGEKGRSNSLEEELAEERERFSSLEAELTEERDNVTTLKTELEGEKGRSNSLEEELAEERERCSLLEAQLTEEREIVTTLKTELEEERDNVTTLKMELEGERDNVTTLKMELEGERDNVTALKTELEGEKNVNDCLREELEKEKEIISSIEGELQNERETRASIFAQVEKQNEQLKQQEEEMRRMKKDLEEQIERNAFLEGDKKELPSVKMEKDKEKAIINLIDEKKKEFSDEPKKEINYGHLYDEFVETLVEKESLEKENEFMMNHFNEKIERLREQAKYFDEKISHYKSLCESYERTNMQVDRCMNKLDEMIEEIELYPNVSDVKWKEKLANIKKVAKDIKNIYEVEKVVTDNPLLDEIIMEKNILMEKILQLESEKANRPVQTTDEGETQSRKDIPDEETRKYMEEMNFKSLRDFFSFHLNILNEFSFTKNCYNQLVEENLMKGREYENEIALLKKMVKEKESEVGVSDENCKSLMLEVENLKYILNDLFTCGGGRVRTAKEEKNSPMVQGRVGEKLSPSVKEKVEEKLSPSVKEKVEEKLSPSVKEKVEEKLSPVVQERVEDSVLISALQEESMVTKELSHIAPNESTLLAEEVPSVGDALSSVSPESAKDRTLQRTPVTVDSKISRSGRNSNGGAASKGRRTTPRNGAGRGKRGTSKEAEKKGDSNDEHRDERKDEHRDERKDEHSGGRKDEHSGGQKDKHWEERKGESQSRTETKTNKETSGNKNCRGNRSRSGSKSIHTERGKVGSDSLVSGSVAEEGGRKYQLRSSNRRK
ncbi:conserved Plasmodium protein, unknown function [Plasmodium knowlesi strain H]|uniref:Uncharacterized protein n=3 Tax=Plasmodium knowlesi TaxID=5850 RepID=A0A5K1USR4_PLAKH|nr:conserved Plasmodium protein, unknown function [Plasmodium knowlesi strain H]OTN68623.1 Uncharacterized protein PKNOH_S01017200 [Plasmodium knowlesi]CAA9986169.1 conserved Plasmodium protein, unknown function [Plasmodium knowlesi strain H]SBO25363.1 conserved Plasmodium protein, unknown function [Plasmodium knowlesi strain H]SBO27663.1 conserved Plasmodium protein, unknown function [Plasmodium knowlesi strain H]VVS75643.1 conserved Plasmodium protein, unknown function [Plasmodium knowlesi s|eukprot:XP_002257580.1 hypothetical protein, conserved in Plasmodium species [Plasmodium knowlesi strain H]